MTYKKELIDKLKDALETVHSAKLLIQYSEPEEMSDVELRDCRILINDIGSTLSSIAGEIIIDQQKTKNPPI